MVGDAPIPPAPRLGIEPVDQIDDCVEPAPGAAPDAGPGYGQMALAGACSAHQHGIALLSQERSGGQITDQRLVDRRAREIELGKSILMKSTSNPASGQASRREASGWQEKRLSLLTL